MFAWLFTQYRKPGRLHFGSKWLNLHGRLLIGSPERFGLQECSENVLTSYYYLRADRKMPVTDDGKFDAWRLDALRASQVRHASEKHVSKAGFIVASAACLALCFSAMVIQKGSSLVSSSSNAVTADQVRVGRLTVEECTVKDFRGQLVGKEREDCLEQGKRIKNKMEGR